MAPQKIDYDGETPAGTATPGLAERLDAAVDELIEERFGGGEEEKGERPSTDGEGNENEDQDDGDEAEQPSSSKGHRAPGREGAEEDDAEAQDGDSPRGPEDAGEAEGETGDDDGDLTEDTDDQGEDVELERALKALRFDRVPSEILKNTPREKLITWGAKAAKRQGSQQKALDERASEIATLKEKAQATSPAESHDGVPTARLDLKSHLKSAAELLGVDEEAIQKAFGPALEAVLAAATKGLEERLSKEVTPLRDSVRQRMVGDNLRRLGKGHPELRTDRELRNRLVEKASALARTGDYESPEEAFDDAAAIVMRDRSSSSPERKRELSVKRRNGISVVPSDRAPDRTPDDFDSYFDRVVERVERGDPKGARRIPRPKPA